MPQRAFLHTGGGVGTAVGVGGDKVVGGIVVVVVVAACCATGGASCFFEQAPRITTPAATARRTGVLMALLDRVEASLLYRERLQLDRHRRRGHHQHPVGEPG